MGLCGLEPQTSRLSGGCSNQLSYMPGERSSKEPHGEPRNPDDFAIRQMLEREFVGRKAGTACSGVDIMRLSKKRPLSAIVVEMPPGDLMRAYARRDRLIGNAKAVEERRATNYGPMTGSFGSSLLRSRDQLA